MAKTYTTRALRKQVEQLVDDVGSLSAFSRCSGVPVPELSIFLSGHSVIATRLFTFLGLHFDPYKGLYVQNDGAEDAAIAVLNVGLAEENARLQKALTSANSKASNYEFLCRELRAQLATQREDAVPT